MRNQNESNGLGETERDALGSLDLQDTPRPELKARIRTALEAEGLLRPDRPKWLGAAYRLAASLLLVIAGFALGRWEERGPEPSPVSPALQVQRAGSDYVRAVATLLEEPNLEPEDLLWARDSGIGVLRGAAGQLARLPGLDEATQSELLRIRYATVLEAGT